jgi:hypothetical protein
MNVISVSTRKSVRAGDHKTFEVVKLHFEDLPSIITKEAWSPITWIQGARAACNYTSCEFLTLDFDDGTQTIDDAKEILQTYKLRGMIGTSKSHQREKTTEAGKVRAPCDRFRLIIPLERNIEDAKTYSYNVKEAMDMLFPGADTACKDAGRFFFPCVDIVYISPHTTAYPIFKYDHEGIDAAQKARRQQMRESGMLPLDVMSYMNGGKIPAGMRNTKGFIVAFCMLDVGYTHEEVFTSLQDMMKDPLPEKELLRIVNQAQRYV